MHNDEPLKKKGKSPGFPETEADFMHPPLLFDAFSTGKYCGVLNSYPYGNKFGISPMVNKSGVQFIGIRRKL
jgi:hypothetical protein